MKQHKILETTFNSIDFLIHKRPVAIYGVDLRASSEIFMRSLNSQYWENILTFAHSIPFEEWSHHHVSFLRQCLSQAEEQLFALIFAYLQAPFCPDLWLYHYRTTELDALAENTNKQESFPSRFKLQDYRWESIYRTIFRGIPDEKYPQVAAITEQLNLHFCSEHARKEYNGMKHSMRLSMGGNNIAFAPSEDSTKPPSDDQYVSLGDSKFGSRQLIFESAGKDHYKAKTAFTNWDPTEIITLLSHCTLLIGNMGSAFRIYNELDGDKQFHTFSKEESYTSPSRKLPGFITCEMNFHYTIPDHLKKDLSKTALNYYSAS